MHSTVYPIPALSTAKGQLVRWRLNGAYPPFLTGLAEAGGRGLCYGGNYLLCYRYRASLYSPNTSIAGYSEPALTNLPSSLYIAPPLSSLLVHQTPVHPHFGLASK